MKKPRFFSTIYFQKHECFCPSSFSDNINSCQIEGTSETSLLAFPISRLSALSGGWSFPKAGVTVSITTLVAQKCCPAAAGVLVRPLCDLPPPREMHGSIPGPSPHKDAILQGEPQESGPPIQADITQAILTAEGTWQHEGDSFFLFGCKYICQPSLPCKGSAFTDAQAGSG